MILETVDRVATGLRDIEHGVEAMIDTVPRFANDPRPTPIRRIYDAANDQEAAYIGRTLDYPCLIVRPNGPVSAKPEQMIPPDRYADVPVSIRYVVQKQMAEQGFKDMSYVLRAITFTLDWLNANAQSTYRSKNGIQLWNMTELTLGEFVEEVGDGLCTGLVECSWYVRDTHQ